MSDTVARFDAARERHRLDQLGGRLVRGGTAAAAVGLAGIAIGVGRSERGLDQLWCSYLVSLSYFLSIALGALFFVILQHLTRAGWSVVLRRLAEAVAANTWLLALLFIPVLFGIHHIYHWSDPAAAGHEQLLQGKASYLNRYFFAARLAVYFAVWGWLGSYFFARSAEQDRSGDPALTRRMERASAPAMVAYAFSVTFASFDILMSLDPHWYSTIFGVYFFAGALLGFLAFLVLVIFVLQQAQRVQRVITPEHYHDLGKLLLAFVVFWAYIAFSQYMLMWYGDIPEETQWFLKRQTGDWAALGIALIFGHFLIPFCALLSRYPKRRPRLLVIPAIWVLIFHWIDLYWLVAPELGPLGRVHWGLLEPSCFLAVGGVFVAGLAHRLRDTSLIPQRDPRLGESLSFENA